MPKPFRPQILSGNLLKSGDVVYRNAEGAFMADFRSAAIAHDPETAQEWLAEAEDASDTLISAYLIAVDIESGIPAPRHYRDRIRILGPTFEHHGTLSEQWQAINS